MSSLSAPPSAQPGDTKHFASSSPPIGWLAADGSAVSRVSYAALFAAIGTIFGAGEGSSTFNLPDLRGVFVRGWDNGRGLDTDSTGFGAFEADAFYSHTHEVASYVIGVNTGSTYTALGLSGGASGSQSAASGGVETRPKNVPLLACIKY